MRTSSLSVFTLIFLAFASIPDRVAAAAVLIAERTEIAWDSNAWLVSVKSDEKWIITTAADWLSIDIAEGEGDRDLEITVQANRMAQDREARITVGDQSLLLTQRGRPSAGGKDATVGVVSALQGMSAVQAPTVAAAAVYGDTFSPDPAFSVRVEASGGEIPTLAKTPDGGFVVGGTFSSVGGLPRRGLAKFKTDGSIDASFNAGPGFNGEIHAVAVQPDGRILVGGIFNRYAEQLVTSLVRLNADGSLDRTFDPEIDVGSGTVNAVAVQTDGKILVGGRYEQGSNGRFKAIDRLNSNGTRDTTYTAGYISGAGEIYVLTLQTDGKILVGGDTVGYEGGARGGVARLNTNGSLDTSFNPGAPQFGSRIHGIAVQPDGKILIGGNYQWEFSGTSYHSLLRLNADGSRDSTFNTVPGWGGEVRAIAVQADGRIVTATTSGSSGTSTVARWTATGSADPLFNSAASCDDLVHAATVLADGRIVIAGKFRIFATSSAGGVAILSSTGTLSTAPTTRLRTTGTVTNALPVAGGKFMLAGYFGWVNGVSRNGIARILADGSLDTSFDPGTGLHDYTTPTGGGEFGATSLAVQADGRMLVGGDFSSYNGVSRSGLIRVNADGSLDLTYHYNAVSGDDVYAISLLADGRSLVSTELRAASGLYFYRVDAAGSTELTYRDNRFTSSSYVNALAVQNNGQVIAGGIFYPSNLSNPPSLIARFTALGANDPTFSASSVTGNSVEGSHVNCLLSLPDGRLVVGGDFNWPERTNRSRVARLQSNGAADTGFNVGTGFDGEVFALALQEDARVVVGGFFDSYNGVWRARLARLNTDGSLDARFAVSGLSGGAPFQVNLLSDGRILVAGLVASRGGALQAGVVMLKPGSDVVPYFTTQPQNASANVGSTITLTSAASGSPAPTYQWFKDGVELVGQTGAVLTLSNVNLAQSGSYQVLAVNSVEAYAISNVATVTVATPPSPPAAGGSGGGGGGGSMSGWFLGAMFALVLLRRFQAGVNNQAK